jgi:hypothetical protein
VTVGFPSARRRALAGSFMVVAVLLGVGASSATADPPDTIVVTGANDALTP